MFFLDNRMVYAILIALAISNVLSGNFSFFALILSLPGVLVAITFHEFAHAYAADKLRRPYSENAREIKFKST